MAKPAFAQTSAPTPTPPLVPHSSPTPAPTLPVPISSPSVPEFSVMSVPSTYYVVSTNPYTGTNVTDTYLNNTIEVVIKNQPFSQPANDPALSLYYNVEEKGHFSDYWNLYEAGSDFYPASDSDYTAMYVGLGEDNGSSYLPLTLNGVIPASSQIDFQVQALIGYFTTIVSNSPVGLPSYQEFIGETSGWSNTQTITIGQTSTSPSTSPNQTLSPTQTQTPTPTPTVPELSWLAIIPLLIGVLSIAVIVPAFKNR